MYMDIYCVYTHAHVCIHTHTHMFFIHMYFFYFFRSLSYLRPYSFCSSAADEKKVFVSQETIDIETRPDDSGAATLVFHGVL